MKYDAVIIGGGHNGLVAAAYLAKAGKKVCVVEKRPVLGGCCSTEELWPGFKVSPAAYVISLFSSKIINDLKLRNYELNILPRDPSSFTPLLDGRSLALGHNDVLNAREIDKFSFKDSCGYKNYTSYLSDIAELIEPLLEMVPPVFPVPWRKLKWCSRISDFKKTIAVAKIMKKIVAKGGDDLLVGSATNFLNRWFESDVLKATLATDAIIGSSLPPSALGSAYVLLHHVMGDVGGKRGVWGYVQGGMGELTVALIKCCTDFNVDILEGTEVREIDWDMTRKIRGVYAHDNDDIFLETKCIVSSLDPNLTFNILCPLFHVLPSGFQKSINNIDYSSSTAKINLALDGVPEFTAAKDQHVSCLNGTIHIAPSLDYIERAFDDSKYGIPSKNPVLEIAIPSMVDRTIAPGGKHIMSILVQYAPYNLSNGQTWDQIRDDFADNCIDVLSRYAPNIKDLILHRQVLTPLDLKDTYGLTGGNIFQGAMVPKQLFSFRPVAGYSDYRTPVRGLYLCGAATHPGGGVTGLCGKNAASVILKDIK